jgi:DNA-binding response OmpR family regulator
LLFRSALRQGHREEVLVSALLLLTNTLQSSADVLPALGLLSHNVRILPAELTGLVDAPTCDVVLLDGRHDLVHVRGLGRLIRTTGIEVPLVLVVTEGGLAVVAADWGFDDVVLDTAGPAEVEARLRLVTGRLAARRNGEPTEPNVIRTGEVVIDEATYTAKVGGKALDLTFKEFELLKFLAQHPGRVFSRQQLLQEVWGYDYFGGTRTVDVHVRRLRAKLGPEHDALIGTVRNVGYRFVLPVRGGDPAERPAQPGAGSAGPGARRAGAATPRRRMQP